jgi:hypothetical protein
MWKWLRQQPKDFYAAGFDAPVKRWDKWKICREINDFYRFEYHTFYVLYPFVADLLTLLRISIHMPTANDSFCGHPVYNWVITYSEACLRKTLGTDPWQYTCISYRQTIAFG